MENKIVWSHEDMISATAEHLGVSEAGCRVIESTDGDDEPCLIVVHAPTGRTSDESGDGGRWHLDGTAYAD